MLLARHFVRRMTVIETAEGSEPDLGVAGILGLLAVPGAIYSFFLFDKYSTFLRVIRGGPIRMDVYAASLPEKYLFITSSMALTALLVALKWDRILPGVIDHSVIAALPVRLRTIFFANVAALGFFAVVFIADLNAVSSILFPMIVLSDVQASLLDNFSFVLAHLCCVLLASAFAFLFCLSILGLLMALVPPRLFQRASGIARFAIVSGCCALLWTAFNGPHPLSRAPWIPPAWYTALYQVLQGRMTPALDRLAFRGMAALAIVFFTAALGLVLSYKNRFMHIAEVFAKPTPTSTKALWPLRFALNQTLLRSGFDRALYWLGLRLLLRSEPHMIRFGAFCALGIVICAGESLSGAALTIASFPLVFLVVVGLRAAIEIPAGSGAMSIFRTCAVYTNAKPLLRKLLLTILSCVLAPVVLAVTLHAGAAMGLMHAVFLGSAAIAIFDCMLFRYIGVPFASSSPGLQNRSLLVVAVYFLAFLAFTSAGPVVERQVLQHPPAVMIAPAIAFVTAFLTRPIAGDEILPDDRGGVQTLGIES